MLSRILLELGRKKYQGQLVIVHTHNGRGMAAYHISAALSHVLKCSRFVLMKKFEN